MKIAVLGADNPDVIEFMIDISNSWYHQGLYEETERLEVHIVDYRKGILGEKHRETLKAMGRLRGTWHEQRRYTDSEALQVQIRDTRKGTLGERYEETLMALLELAMTWLAARAIRRRGICPKSSRGDQKRESRSPAFYDNQRHFRFCNNIEHTRTA